MSILKTYKCKILKGSIPGDQCVEWWTEKDWDRHREHVAELKASGEYLKEEEVTLSLWGDPAFDDNKFKPLKKSYSYTILDSKNNDHTEI